VGVAGAVQAQQGAVCLYADPAGTACSLTDNAPGLLPVYIIHHPLPGGAMAVQFAAPVPSCMVGAVWLGDSWSFPLVIGTSQTGVSVGYQSCQTGPIFVGTMNFFVQALTTADCAYPVIADPAAMQMSVLEVDCNAETALAINGGVTYVNSSLPCDCGSAPTDPLLYVNPLTVDIGTGTSGSFAIANIGGGTLTWDVSESASWLEVFPTTGSGNETINLTVDRTGLMAGFYSAAVEVTSNGGNETVTVQMEVQGPVLGVSPTSFDFGAGGTSAYLNISNEGGFDLNWTITPSDPWLSVDVAAGTNDATVTVMVDRAGLPDGNYSGQLAVNSNGGNTVVPVHMQVLTQPILSVAPLVLNFTSSITTLNLSISNVGVGTLDWSLASPEPWVEIGPPTAGSGNTMVPIHVNTATVPSGPQSTWINVTSNGGNAVVTVNYTPGPAGYGGAIGLYADATGTDCNLVDVPNSLVTIYVVHAFVPGATASQFSAPLPACATGMIYLADSQVFPVTIGNSQTGVSIGYGACYSSPIHILTIQFLGQGLSDCCPYAVLPHPEAPSGQVEAVDCNNQLTIATGVSSIVSTQFYDCPCGVIKVEETTWGQVKAMYADPD